MNEAGVSSDRKEEERKRKIKTGLAMAATALAAAGLTAYAMHRNTPEQRMLRMQDRFRRKFRQRYKRYRGEE